MEVSHRPCLWMDENLVSVTVRQYFAALSLRLEPFRDIAQILSCNNSLAFVIEAKSVHNVTRFHHQVSALKVPIIIVDARYNEERCINFLQLGADDYLVKPLKVKELYSRITAIQRRIHPVSQGSNKEVYCFDGWRLYPRCRRFINEQGQGVDLSNGEFELLMEFLQQPQTILTRDYLLHVTKNIELGPFDRRIDVQISRLRQKIEKNAKTPVLIKTVRNSGYVLTMPVHHGYEQSIPCE